jgi:hypothetical protein
MIKKTLSVRIWCIYARIQTSTTTNLNCDRTLQECNKTGIWRGHFVTCRTKKK